MKKYKSKQEWLRISLDCETAYLLAPKWSPMRYFFKWGVWYANRKAQSAKL